MQIYYHQVDLEDGFKILSEPGKHDRLIRGRRVHRPSGWGLFSCLEGQPISCWHCGVVADRWIAEKGRRDKVGQAVLNLHAGLRLMTRDHIIPKSLGGVDDVHNLRPGCEPCNSSRGNDVDAETLRFAQAHPELIDAGRIRSGLETLQRNITSIRARYHSKAEIEAAMQPFKVMGYL